MTRHKESKFYKELKLSWRRDYWTWDRIHNMGRNSSDAGVRMECEKLAVKIVKGIPLLENDIRFLDRTNVKLRKCVGHSEWSERYQCNVWVSDYEEK